MIRNVVFFCSVTILLSSAADLPNYITKCSLSDPALNDCLKKQANIMIANIVNGDANLGVPNKHKLKVPKVKLEPNSKFTIDIDNCDGIGLNTFKVLDMKMNQKFQLIQFSGVLEEFIWECSYKANGALLSKKFKDKGFVNINFTNSAESYSASYHIEEINGTSYYQVDNDIFEIKNSNIVFNVIPTDGNDKQASELNEILNEEAFYFSRKLLPKIEEMATVMVTELINQIFGSVPAPLLFNP